MFARYGLPEHLHSDNGSQFTSEVFRNVMKANNIRHTFSALYHPATNGQVERFVQTFKQAMRSARDDSGAIKRHLAQFLFAYRNAPHATTGDSPAMLLMGRGLRTRLDVIRPNTRKTVENHQATSIEERRGQHRAFEVGDIVAVRNYRNDHKWVPGTIQEKKGTRSYAVLVEEGTVWQRHSDQIRASDIIMVPSAVEVPVVDESTGTAVEAEEDRPPIPVQTPMAVNHPVRPAIPVQIPRAVDYSVRRSTRIRKSPEKLDL